MLLKMGPLELRVSLKGQMSGELTVDGGTLFVVFGENLTKIADTKRNDERRKRIDACPLGRFPAEEIVLEHGKPFEMRLITLDTEFESLSAPLIRPQLLRRTQPLRITTDFGEVIVPPPAPEPSVKKIFLSKEGSTIFHPIARNFHIPTASMHKTKKDEAKRTIEHTLIAVSTASDLSGATCVAFIQDEKNEKALQFTEGELQNMYKEWEIYETPCAAELLMELFSKYSGSFKGFYAGNSQRLNIVPEEDEEQFNRSGPGMS